MLPEDSEILKIRPAMFRNKPFTFLGCVILIPVGIGIVLLLLWWIETLAQTLFMSDKFTLYREGILRHHDSQVYHVDVTVINVTRSVFDRMLGVGDIEIGSAATDTCEIVVSGVRNPNDIRRLINSKRFST